MKAFAQFFSMPLNNDQCYATNSIYFPLQNLNSGFSNYELQTNKCHIQICEDGFLNEILFLYSVQIHSSSAQRAFDLWFCPFLDLKNFVERVCASLHMI